MSLALKSTPILRQLHHFHFNKFGQLSSEKWMVSICSSPCLLTTQMLSISLWVAFYVISFYFHFHKFSTKAPLGACTGWTESIVLPPWCIWLILVEASSREWSTVVGDYCSIQEPRILLHNWFLTPYGTVLLRLMNAWFHIYIFGGKVK